jgi:hypothetical protein
MLLYLDVYNLSEYYCILKYLLDIIFKYSKCISEKYFLFYLFLWVIINVLLNTNLGFNERTSIYWILSLFLVLIKKTYII